MESLIEFEIGLNMNTITYPVYLEVSKYLDPKSVFTWSMVSKECCRIITSAHFLMSYSKALGLSLKNLKPSVERVSQFFISLIKQVKIYNFHNLQLEGIEASSTDYNQSIFNTLIEKCSKYWSSRGSETQEAEEYLLFAFKNFSMLKSLKVDFFPATEYEHENDYPSNQIKISLGLSQSEWFYESKPFQVNNSMSVDLNIENDVSIARFIKVTFIGKPNQQDSDELYYVAVQRIQAFGYNIDPWDGSQLISNSLFLQSLCNYYNTPVSLEDCKLIRASQYYIDDIEKHRTLSNTNQLLRDFGDLLKDTKCTDDDRWQFLENHKELLLELQMFEDVLRYNSSFGESYFKFVKKRKNRNYLTSYETYLVCMVSIKKQPKDVKSSPSNLTIVIEPELLGLFNYFTFERELFERICDKMTPKHQELKVYLAGFAAKIKEKLNLYEFLMTISTHLTS